MTLSHLQGDAGGWLRDHCLQTGDAFLIVFSVTDRRSFSKVPETLLRLRAGRPHHDLPVILVGNKSDLARSREVSLEGRYPEPHPHLQSRGILSFPCHLFSIKPFYPQVHRLNCKGRLSMPLPKALRIPSLHFPSPPLQGPFLPTLPPDDPCLVPLLVPIPFPCTPTSPGAPWPPGPVQPCGSLNAPFPQRAATWQGH